MRSYVIGRSSHADIVLADPTVARRHAELVATDDGRFYLTDCRSESGTWRRRDDGPTEPGEPRWERLRQAFVAPEAPLRFGEHQASLRELLGLAAPREERAEGAGPGRWRWDGLGGSEDESGPRDSGKAAAGFAGGRPRGKVERDPVTGEIVAKRW